MAVVYVFADHNGIVHHNSECDEERKHGNHVEAYVHGAHEEEGAEEGDRNAEHDPEGQAQFKEKAEQNENQRQSHHAVLEQQAHAPAEHVGPVVPDGVLEPVGHGFAQVFEHLECGGLDGERGFLPDAVERNAHGGLAVVERKLVGLVEVVADISDIFEPELGAIRRGDDRDAGEFAPEVAAVLDAHKDFAATGLHRRRREAPVRCVQ